MNGSVRPNRSGVASKTQMDVRYVVITGAPGTGKTALATLLKEEMPFCTFAENVTHPFVRAYFRQPNRWSFHLSVLFMVQSLEAMVAARTEVMKGRSVCWDYDPRCHYEIFCRQLRREQRLSDNEYAVCRRLHHILMREYVVPDLLVFLRAKPELLYERLKVRNRRNELGSVSKQYLARLSARFDTWFKKYSGMSCCIDTGIVDFLRSASDRDFVLQRLRVQLLTSTR